MRYGWRGGAVLVGVMLIGLAGCDIGAIGLPPITTPTVPIAARVGQEFTVTLHSNPTTGFRWALAAPLDATRVALVGDGSRYVRTEGDAPGAGGVEIWTFRGVGAGQTTITLQYSRPNDPNIAPGPTETFTVNVQ
jgi:inhibitor of cysteine peptidase